MYGCGLPPITAMTRAMMSVTLDYKNFVLFVCSCSQRVPLDELYFCRHCKLARCNDCVSTVIETSCVSCPHCFENVPYVDARGKKNRCAHCFQCPQCSSNLSTRYVIVPTESLSSLKDGEEDDKPAESSPSKLGLAGKRATSMRTSPRIGRTSPRSLRSGISGGSLRSPGGMKYYYLACTHCRWTTRDVQIKDKRSPLDFKDRPHPFQDQVTKLLAYYRDLELKELSDREQVRKMMGRKIKPYASLLDPSRFKTGDISSPPKLRRGLVGWRESPKLVSVAADAGDPEPLPEEMYVARVNVDEITTLDQRFLDPSHQLASTHDLWPRPLMLTGKKLHRCKGCDHIMLKADLSPSSIRFKIQHVAMHTIPRVRLSVLPKLSIGEQSKVLLTFANPVNYPISLSFSTCPEVFLRRVKEKFQSCILPEGTFMLPPNDDVADVLEEESIREEDSIYVYGRQPGKLVLKFSVTTSSLMVDSKIVFLMKFTYKPVIEADKEPVASELEIPVIVNCGHCSA